MHVPAEHEGIPALGRWGVSRFAVTGESMLPTLRPGDRLIVRTGADVAADDVVVARHPRRPAQLIVKRAVHRMRDGWWLESDNQRAPGRQDSWDFDTVPDRLIVGRVVARYRLLSVLPISASVLSRRRPGRPSSPGSMP